MCENMVEHVIRDLLLDFEDNESAERALSVFRKDDESAEGSLEASEAAAIRK